MKIRHGFVSNSSSSSFIIIAPKNMEPTADNFHQAIWGTDEKLEFPAMYGGAYGDIPVDSKPIAEDIVRQIEEGHQEDGYGDESRKIMDLAAVIEADDGPDMDDYIIPPADGVKSSSYDWPAYEAAVDVANEKAAAKMIAKYPDSDFYVVSYGDGEGSFNAAVEHGPALNDSDKIIRYNHH